MKFVVSDLSIRPYAPTDTARIVAMINKDPFHFLNGITETRFEQDLDEPGERIRENTFVVEIDETVIAYLSLCFVESNSHISVYCYATVDVDWRRRGVGTVMFKFIFTRLQEISKSEQKTIHFIHRAVTRISGETNLAINFGMQEQNTLEVLLLNNVVNLVFSKTVSDLSFHAPTIDDVGVWADIYNDAFGANKSRESVAYEFQGTDFSSDLYILCVDDKGKPVGFVSSLFRGSNARIPTIAVRRDFQGRGIGKALLGEVLQRLKRSGAEEIRLTVDSQNVAAKSLYHKLGFREEYKRVHYVKYFQD